MVVGVRVDVEEIWGISELSIDQRVFVRAFVVGCIAVQDVRKDQCARPVALRSVSVGNATCKDDTNSPIITMSVEAGCRCAIR